MASLVAFAVGGPGNPAHEVRENRPCGALIRRNAACKAWRYSWRASRSIQGRRFAARSGGQQVLAVPNAHPRDWACAGRMAGGPVTEGEGPYTDTEPGTWTGPDVVAVHGGPAPFQDHADPETWVEGERDPLASQYNFSIAACAPRSWLTVIVKPRCLLFCRIPSTSRSSRTMV